MLADHPARWSLLIIPTRDFKQFADRYRLFRPNAPRLAGHGDASHNDPMKSNHQSSADLRRSDHSERNARTGSVLVARQAGSRLDASAATIITANASAKDSGSRGLTL